MTSRTRKLAPIQPTSRAWRSATVSAGCRRSNTGMNSMKAGSTAPAAAAGTHRRRVMAARPVSRARSMASRRSASASRSRPCSALACSLAGAATATTAVCRLAPSGA